MPQTWIETPTQAEAIDPNNWVALTSNERTLMRCLFLIDDREDSAPAMEGPEQLTLNQPPGVDYTLSKKRLIKVSQTVSLQDFLQLSVSEAHASEYATRAGVGFGAAALDLRNHISKRIARAITVGAQTSLRRNEQYSVKLTDKLSQSISIGPANTGNARRLHLVLMLKKRRARVWLYRCETAIVRISRKFGIFWLERKVDCSSWLPRVPCFEVEYYVPQEILSVHEGAYSATVADAEGTKIAALSAPCPRPVRVPRPTLDNLAELAFPESRLAELQASAPAKRLKKRVAGKTTPEKGASTKLVNRVRTRKKGTQKAVGKGRGK